MIATMSHREAAEQGYIVYRVESPVYLRYVRYCRDNNLPLISLRLKSSYAVAKVDLRTTADYFFSEEDAAAIEKLLVQHDDRKIRETDGIAVPGGLVAYASRVPSFWWNDYRTRNKTQDLMEALVDVLKAAKES